jgi:hypothetical protein
MDKEFRTTTRFWGLLWLRLWHFDPVYLKKLQQAGILIDSQIKTQEESWTQNYKTFLYPAFWFSALAFWLFWFNFRLLPLIISSASKVGNNTISFKSRVWMKSRPETWTLYGFHTLGHMG